MCESSNLNPCGNKGICIPDYFKDSFRCKCDDGFGGIPSGKCQKKRYPGWVLLFDGMLSILDLELEEFRSYFIANKNFVCRVRTFNNNSLQKNLLINPQRAQASF